MKIITQMFYGAPGRVILPDDYLTNPSAMVLLTYTAGAGQHPGNPQLGTPEKNYTDGTVDMLYDNNGALTRARDGLLNNIIDPETGKAYRFAVVALQGRSTIPAQPDTVFQTVNYLTSTFNIDKTRIFKTGLSAGGKLTIDCLGSAQTGSMFAAGVEMSTPQFITPDWSKNGHGKLLAFHGTADGGVTAYSNSVLAVDTYNAAKKGFAFLISIQGGNHGGWDANYDPANRWTIPGYSKKLNIYEWCLMVVSKPTFLFTASGTEAGSGGTTPPTPVTTKAIAVVTATNGTAICDSSKSTVNGGTDAAVSAWDFTPKGSVWFQGGSSSTGKLQPATALALKPNTAYTFKLTVYDKYGANDTVSVSFTTDASGNGSASSDGTTTTPPTTGGGGTTPPTTGGGGTTPTTPTVVAEFDVTVTTKTHIKAMSDGTEVVGAPATTVTTS